MVTETNILLVEDDIDLGHMLKLYLEMDNFSVTLVDSAEEASQQIKNKSFSLAIFDVNLPGKSGFELARGINEDYPALPFLFLTARTMKTDRIMGLKIGADDYITKPFDAEELILRIQNILKRSGNPSSSELRFGDFILNLTDLQLIHPNKIQSLTRREVELLQYLVKFQNKLVPTKNILQDLWGEDDYFLGRSMNVFISRLRKYLSLDPGVTIRNVRAEGYELIVRSASKNQYY